jgi:hypothetical protein
MIDRALFAELLSDLAEAKREAAVAQRMLNDLGEVVRGTIAAGNRVAQREIATHRGRTSVMWQRATAEVAALTSIAGLLP